MNKTYLITLLCALIFLQIKGLSADPSKSRRWDFSFWNADYEGTIGEKEIGMTLVRTDVFEYIENVKKARYYYKEYLKDIDLEVARQEGRSIVLKEYDKDHRLTGTFELSYADKDPKGHFKSEKLTSGILLGNWTSGDGKIKYPVYLRASATVVGTLDGGRCGMSGTEYLKAQERITKFYYAVINDDKKVLLENFRYKRPITKELRETVATAVPHNMFCNYQGIMLGSGVVWFDYEGNPIEK